MPFAAAEPFHWDVPHPGLVPVAPGVFVPIIHAGPSAAAPPHLEAPHAAFGPFLHGGLGGFGTEPVAATGLPRFAAPTFIAPTLAAPALGLRRFPRFGFPAGLGTFPAAAGLGGFGTFPAAAGLGGFGGFGSLAGFPGFPFWYE